MVTVSSFEALPMNTPELRVAVASTIPDRISEHQRRIKERGSKLGAPNGGLILIAHGDSWFDYPLGGAGGGISDTIEHLNEKKGAPETMQILNFAHWGAPLVGVSIRNAKNDPEGNDPDAISGTFMLGQIKRAIKDPAKNGIFDGMLISAGGNDFAGDQFRGFLNDADTVDSDPDRALNAAFDQRLNEIVQGFEILIAFRDANLRGKPIFINGYDNAIPNGHAVCKDRPAWLKPSLDARNWTDPDRASKVVLNALERFRARLDKLGRNTFLVPTAGTLPPSEWANELHPTEAGFERIAGVFQRSLHAFPLFASRV